MSYVELIHSKIMIHRKYITRYTVVKYSKLSFNKSQAIKI